MRDALAAPETAFYRDVYGDADRTQGLRDTVGSVLHAMKQPHDAPSRASSGKYAGESKPSHSKDRKYTVTKEVCVAGVEPAKRPKY